MVYGREEDTYEEQTVPKTPAWNFADDSLKRVSMALFQLGMTSVDITLNPVMKLKMRIELLKVLFQWANPLTKIESHIQNEILHLKIPVIVRTKGITTKVIQIYDSKLDFRIDELTMYINNKLQEKGYFMPSFEESSMF